MEVRGRGLGKLILCGEHAVVYGHPAIAIAVDRGLEVTLRERPGPTRAAGLSDPRLDRALRATLPASGLEVHITSDLPTGRGMGSSAALAVALVRARAALTGDVPTPEQVFDEAFAIERIFHGNPSGLDHLVSSRGGAVVYTRNAPFRALPCPDLPLVVLDSGTEGDTAHLVAGVASRRPRIDPHLQAIGDLVAQVESALSQPSTLGPLLTENHRLLQAIGVSTPALDDLVALALASGAAGAKLSGAGGGGIVVAVADDPDRVLAAAEARGVAAFRCRCSESP